MSFEIRQSPNNFGAVIEGYEIYVNQGVDGSLFSKVDDYDGNSADYTLIANDVFGQNTFSVGGFYRIKTRAFNSIDFSLFSEELIVALARRPSTPSQPTFGQNSNRFEH